MGLRYPEQIFIVERSKSMLEFEIIELNLQEWLN